jgi:hypothetical protein
MKARLVLALVVAAALSACQKAGSPPVAPSNPPTNTPAVSLESLVKAAPANLAPAVASAEAPPDSAPVLAAPATQSTTNLSAEIRRKRNLEWLKILAAGNAQQKQKVQDQLTHLSSDELTELSDLYDQQKRK